MNSLHISHHPCAAAGDDTHGGDTGGSGKVAQAKESIARAARETKQNVKTAASDTAHKAREAAERVVTEKREDAADRIKGYSSAFHESARSFEEQDPNIAWFTHQAADRLQQMAEYVRARDWVGLRHDVEDVARKHPAVFFGGMFAAGLLMGNAMKASRRPHDTEEFEPSYQPTYEPSANQPPWPSGGYEPVPPTNPTTPTTDLPTNTPGTGY